MKKLQNKYFLLVLCFVVILFAVFAIAQKNQKHTSKQLSESISGSLNDKTMITETDWKDYSFNDIGLSFSAKSDLSVSSDHTNGDSFILTIQRGKYPEEKYYQLYGVYNLAAKNVLPNDLKKDLETTSIVEENIGGFTAVAGQYKGERNRFVTYIITNRGLFTLATSQPTDKNNRLTEEILKTFKFE